VFVLENNFFSSSSTVQESATHRTEACHQTTGMFSICLPVLCLVLKRKYWFWS